MVKDTSIAVVAAGLIAVVAAALVEDPKKFKYLDHNINRRVINSQVVQ